MNEKSAETERKALPKSFMTVGPTLHYSHQNVLWCWFVAICLFVLTAGFWSKIISGSFWSFDFQDVFFPEMWHLGGITTRGVSIFEYPWQILVLGILMGILAVVPVLISQLMSFRYSLPFVLAIFFLAGLPAFSVCVLISCFAAACRPLRFRSRFIAIALCMSPQLLYWGFRGGARLVEPIQWGFSFAPWICAWIIGLGIAAFVLGIGHFTRYRPGLVWIFTTVFFLLAVVTFEIRIGFDELDYQLYVAGNNPADVKELQGHSISESLDRTINNRSVRKYLASFFYPTDANLLRSELKREIQIQLSQGRWPNWFLVSPPLQYQERIQLLLKQYDKFINRRPGSPRMPIVLYYKAILSEYRPDLDAIVEQELLHFYRDYPHDRAGNIWWNLNENYGESPESIEARWRMANIWAGQGRFEQARELLLEAHEMTQERLKKLRKSNSNVDTIFSPFKAPATSVMTVVKLEDLERRLNHLRSLISPENRGESSATQERLAVFVRLNRHSLDYDSELNKLLVHMDDDDPLRDNVLLAHAKLIKDDKQRAERFMELHSNFQRSDGGLQALYELARLRIGQYQNASKPEQKQEYLGRARALLTSFLTLYPGSFWSEQVQKVLDGLPKVE